MITNVYITFRSGHINHKQRGFSSVTFAAPVIINGKRGNVAVVVQQKGKNKYHVHRILMPDGSKFVYENIQKMQNLRAIVLRKKFLARGYPSVLHLL